jgi:hypothetical protein
MEWFQSFDDVVKTTIGASPRLPLYRRQLSGRMGSAHFVFVRHPTWLRQIKEHFHSVLRSNR